VGLRAGLDAGATELNSQCFVMLLNNNEKAYSSWSAQCQNPFIAILHSSLTLMLMYCRHNLAYCHILAYIHLVKIL
jgi:hypothetical protein